MDSDMLTKPSTVTGDPPQAGALRRMRVAKGSTDSGRCRANSRRGTTDAIRPSYPPVQSVKRALEILRILNSLRIATVRDLHATTSLPKPTIVRMLDTLIAAGYVARDNMCGGYRVTRRVRELNSGYNGVAQIIEASRPYAIDLTQRIKWPVGIGIFDGDAIAVHFWTGTISPWVHANTLLGHRPNLKTSAMGRAHMAFCPDAERDALIRQMKFSPADESEFRAMLGRIRESGYALRAPETEPRRNTTVGMPIRSGANVLASITVSYFTSALPQSAMVEKIVEPLKATVAKIEEMIAFMRAADSQPALEGELGELEIDSSAFAV